MNKLIPIFVIRLWFDMYIYGKKNNFYLLFKLQKEKKKEKKKMWENKKTKKSKKKNFKINKLFIYIILKFI